MRVFLPAVNRSNKSYKSDKSRPNLRPSNKSYKSDKSKSNLRPSNKSYKSDKSKSNLRLSNKSYKSCKSDKSKSNFPRDRLLSPSLTPRRVWSDNSVLAIRRFSN